MRLSDRDIELWMFQKKIIIEPTPNLKSIHGITIDIHLGNQFHTFCENFSGSIDLRKHENDFSVILNNVTNKKILLSNNESFLLNPGRLALAVTLEKVVIPDNLV